MKLSLDPETLAARLSAKLGGVPFQVVVHVAGKRDLLVVDAHQLSARRPGQSVGEFRAWSISEYRDLDPQDALAKLVPKIEKVEVLTTENGSFKGVATFKRWLEFAAWLRDVKEPVERFTVEFPASVYRAAKKLARRRKREGGRGTMRDLVVAAMEEYIERHS